MSIQRMMVLALLASAACSSEPVYTAEDFDQLAFVLGTWRGAAPGEPVFFETYERASDTLILIHYHADSSLSAAPDTGSVYLANGSIVHTFGTAMWQVASLDEAGFHFQPVRNADNAFSWQPTDGAWSALLHFSDGTDLQYALERVNR